MEVESEVNFLVKDLKDSSIWNKLKCVYPLIGTSKKGPKNKIIFNLKDIPKYKRIDKIEKIFIKQYYEKLSRNKRRRTNHYRELF